ncbi:MAG TPA: hypothetical protein VLX89_08505 [Actinomycetota bacterium]|nr:hypothetical protein [Actinomycetota bacterium]
MTFKKFSKRAIVTSLFLGVVLASTVALASWLATGTGKGYAKATSALPLTTSAATLGSSSLYPGGSADVYITVNNPNPYPVTVTDVAGNGAIVTTDNNATCDGATGVTFTSQSGLTFAVAANSSASTTFAGAAHMSNASDDACQGETFSIPVSITGHSG